MKKLFLRLIATVIVSTGIFTFAGCGKEDDTESANQIVKTEKTIPGKSIVTADMKGALDGAAKGATTGAAIAGATGAGWGALFGGIVGGTIASIDQYRENHPSTSVDTTTQFQPSISFPNSIKNSLNPFDSIGLIHYEIVAMFMANPALCRTNSGTLDYPVFYTTIFNILINNYPSLQITTAVQNYFKYTDFESVRNDMNDDFSIIANNCIQNDDLRQIVISYQQFFDSETEYTSFCSYSISVESQIINNTLYSDIEKQIVLSYMATARYGFWFWENYCGGF